MRKLFIAVTILLVVGTVAAAKMKAYVGYDKAADFGAIRDAGHLGRGLGPTGARDDKAPDHQ